MSASPGTTSVTPSVFVTARSTSASTAVTTESESLSGLTSSGWLTSAPLVTFRRPAGTGSGTVALTVNDAEGVDPAVPVRSTPVQVTVRVPGS